METKSKFSVVHIISMIAVAGFLACFFCFSKYIGDLYRRYIDILTVADVIRNFFRCLYDYIIYIVMAVSVALYRKNTRAMPIVMIAYLCYVGLVVFVRDLILDKGNNSGFFGLACVGLALVASVIWLVKPERFKWLSLLFAPYVMYLLYVLVFFRSVWTVDTGYVSSYFDFTWMHFVYNICEAMLFIGIILKCTIKEDRGWHIEEKEYIYWIPSVLAILVQCGAFLVIMV